jgi:tetratricopeptide (TPR) repeat protein
MAFLEKLEKDLLYFDMHNELIVVYSAFKKMNLYSQKYFHFSQLFNKHIAFSLSLEKSDEILGNFNRVLRQYDFSRSTTDLETLLFLRKEITDHHTLNSSRQIEIIKNLIELMLVIYCHTDLNNEFDLDEKLKHTSQLIDELPSSMSSSNFMPALDLLFFEYFYQRGQTKNAIAYYEKINNGLESLLLYSNTCPSAAFLISKISFLQEQGRPDELRADAGKELLHDTTDFHSVALLGIYRAMIAYYMGNFKEATARLNELLNLNSFKDYFHINCDIKLTLCFIYIKLGDLELADNILKSVYRKIKAQNLNNYANVLDIIKVFGEDVKHVNHKPSAKQRDSFALFMARNTKGAKVLGHLIYELKAKYS